MRGMDFTRSINSAPNDASSPWSRSMPSKLQTARKRHFSGRLRSYSILKVDSRDITFVLKEDLRSGLAPYQATPRGTVTVNSMTQFIPKAQQSGGQASTALHQERG